MSASYEVCARRAEPRPQGAWHGASARAESAFELDAEANHIEAPVLEDREAQNAYLCIAGCSFTSILGAIS